MGKIKELTKNTLFQLKEENLPTTPENYFIEFKNQAQISDVEIAEFELFNSTFAHKTELFFSVNS